jgi:hypothetical protein
MGKIVSESSRFVTVGIKGIFRICFGVKANCTYSAKEVRIIDAKMVVGI